MIDLPRDRWWTFGELRTSAESGDASETVFAQGASSEFVLSVLRAWRTGAVLCPLEEGQPRPDWSALPAGCAHLKTTSATTGRARLIAFTQEQLAADADQIVATMGLRPDWPNVAVISLAHSYGFSNLVLPLLLHGIPLVLASSPLPEALRQACRVVSLVTLPAVPALWRAWLDAGELPDRIRLAISAGAPLPLTIEAQAFEHFGLKIHNFYGSSECGGIAYDRSGVPRADAAAVGQAMDGVNLSVSDGCLEVRSRAVGTTYLPEPIPELGCGRFLTSDVAEIHNGLVFLRGRRSDMINVAGRKVSPETIEQVLAGHPAVQECLVFGAPSPDSNRTEMIVACVATRTPATAEALRQHLLENLPAWQLPRTWWFVPDLRVNSRGKLARGAWRQRYLGQLGHRP